MSRPISPLPAEEPHRLAARQTINLADLQRSLRRPRSLVSFALTTLTTLFTLAALVPLFAVLYMLVVRGGRRLSLEIFTELPPTAMEAGGGFGNAIVGTLAMVGIASLISVPVGVFAAVFLAEVSPEGQIAQFVRFSAKVLTGMPSILAGYFTYAAIVVGLGMGFSAVAGGIALSILMLPTVLLTAEDAVRMVPSRLREAAYGMGATQAQVVWKVLLPTAMPGILTGIMLAVARAAGETAPLLVTALFSNYWLYSHGQIQLLQPTASLAVLIYNFSSSPYDNQVELAWAAALVLVLFVLVFNLVGRALSARSHDI
ncbi:MAG: phosphate ABC transporter permease PstA [Planctomycetota bacterium]